MNLDDTSIQEALRDCATPYAIQVHEEVTSTNDVARDLGLAGARHGVVVFTEHQSAGRGRRDNRWLMPRGQDLIFSVLLRPEVPVEHWPRLTTTVALAICKGIEAELPLAPRIKWPNDIYLGDRKAAGILAETFSSGGVAFVVLGIGINVNTTSFDPELLDSATSLCLQLDSDIPQIDRDSLAAAILRALDSEMSRMADEFAAIVDEVRARSWLLGKSIRATVDGAEVYGRAADLNHEGHLVVALPDGDLRALASAEHVRSI